MCFADGKPVFHYPFVAFGNFDAAPRPITPIEHRIALDFK